MLLKVDWPAQLPGRAGARQKASIVANLRNMITSGAHSIIPGRRVLSSSPQRRFRCACGLWGLRAVWAPWAAWAGLRGPARRAFRPTPARVGGGRQHRSASRPLAVERGAAWIITPPDSRPSRRPRNMYQPLRGPTHPFLPAPRFCSTEGSLAPESRAASAMYSGNSIFGRAQSGWSRSLRHANGQGPSTAGVSPAPSDARGGTDARPGAHSPLGNAQVVGGARCMGCS